MSDSTQFSLSPSVKSLSRGPITMYQITDMISERYLPSGNAGTIYCALGETDKDKLGWIMAVVESRSARKDGPNILREALSIFDDETNREDFVKLMSNATFNTNRSSVGRPRTES